MFVTKLKCAILVLLVVGMATLSAGALISGSWAGEPTKVQTAEQERGQGNSEDLQLRVLEMKQQLQHMQAKLARLERETLARRDESNTRPPGLVSRLKHRVAFELGYTEFKEGGRIDIKEIWGTRPRIEEGGQYLVRGKYELPPGERATLYFYATATEGGWGQTSTLDLQYIALDKEKGEFELLHGMAGPGSFHLYLAHPERYSRTFANVYFGTGDNVLRKKP
jgi:hypothetical protein